jgi:hypothetical protein
VHTLVDIAGGDAQVGLGAPGGTTSAWVMFAVSGVGTVRVGDLNTAIARGIPVPAGGILMLPYKASNYNLDDLFVYAPTGTTVSVAYA